MSCAEIEILSLANDRCAVLLELDAHRGCHRVSHLKDLLITSMASSLTRAGARVLAATVPPTALRSVQA